MSLSHGTIGWSVIRDCDISSYAIAFAGVLLDLFAVLFKCFHERIQKMCQRGQTLTFY